MGRSWVCSYGLLGWQGQVHGTTCSYVLLSAAVISTHASPDWTAAHLHLAYKCRDSEAVSGRFAKVLDALLCPSSSSDRLGMAEQAENGAYKSTA